MESSRVWPITNEMTKMGILTNDNFIKLTNLAKNFKKFGKKLSRMTNGGMSMIVGFTKMTYFAKFANLAKDSLKVWQKN